VHVVRSEGVYVINLILNLLGLLTRVKAHTRMRGAVRVVKYWRKAS
jgi:hypothetical protein